MFSCFLAALATSASVRSSKRLLLDAFRVGIFGSKRDDRKGYDDIEIEVGGDGICISAATDVSDAFATIPDATCTLRNGVALQRNQLTE